MMPEGVWGQLSEHDRMELMSFDSSVEHQGFDYALENYGPRFEDPELLDDIEAVFELTGDARESWWRDHDKDGVDLINAHRESGKR